jgi:Tol biopolymer transport system component
MRSGIWAATGAAAAALAAAAWVVGSRADAGLPAFEQLSFRRGWVDSARFGPDGTTIVYSGAFDGEAPAVYTGRIGSRESRSLDLPSGLLLSVSPSSELAIAVGSTQWSGSLRKAGILARVPLAGGAPREVEGSVLWSDWSPDGEKLALVRELPDGQRQLEYPIGHVIEQSASDITYIRISPRGDRIAYIAYPRVSNLGSLVVVDLSGSRVTLAEALFWPLGLVWHPDGETILFAAGDGTGTSTIHAMSLTRRDRIVYRAPGYLTLLDRASDGRLLIARDDWRVESIVKAPGSAEERDVSWLDVSNVADITRDGSRVAIVDLGIGAGSKVVSYLRGTDGSPAIRLSEGAVRALSPDGKRAIVQFGAGPKQAFRIVPTGPGEAVDLTAKLPGIVTALFWHPRANQLIATAAATDQPSRCYVVDLDNGAARAVTPAKTSCSIGAVSPDGQVVLAADGSGALAAYPIAGGEPRPIPFLEPGETSLGWSTDGQSVFVRQKESLPVRVTRIAIADGQRRTLAVLGPRDRAGVATIGGVVLAGDGAGYAYSFLRRTSTLFLVSGLK